MDEPMTNEEREEVERVFNALNDLGGTMFTNPRFTDDDMAVLGNAHGQLQYMLARSARLKKERDWLAGVPV